MDSGPGDRMLAEAIELHEGGGEPVADEVRIVAVPMKSEDEIPTGALRSIADQCGANDVEAWCRWIEENS